MAPILKDTKSQIGDKAIIIKVDIDKSPDAAALYQVKSVPTLILFKQGKVQWKQSGVVPSHELVRILKQFE